ncbi:MAG: hypothetical protein AAGD01_17320 [Acidobacteriota bacterium]
MSHPNYSPTLFYRNVLGEKAPAFFRRGNHLAPNLDKPEGYRDPLVFFGWSVLEGTSPHHHHTANDEFLLLLEGEITVHLLGSAIPGGDQPRFAESYRLVAGDVVLIPQAWVHKVDDTWEHGTSRYLSVFNNQDFVIVVDEFDQAAG